METAFWAFTLRFLQAGMDASLTLLIGALTAAFFRRIVGPTSTRLLFGSSLRGFVIGWIAGNLLPVCALGTIPVARELRRCGVPGGTVLSFVLAAPLLDPISFLYGLSLAEPTVILVFVSLSLVLSTAAGYLWDKLFARSTDAAESAARGAQADADPTPPEGLRRILSIFTTAAQDLTGRNLAFYAVGLAGTAVLAVVIPFGALQRTMHHSDKLSPVYMTALAVPLFATPLSGMTKIGLMFDHGNSIGAAFALFALGIGTSLGTLAWMVADYGWRRVLPWFATYVLLVVGMAYVCEVTLYDHRKAEADHTHAFDDYSSPFPAATTDLPALTLNKLKEKFGPMEQPAVGGFFGLVAAGCLVRRLDANGRVERWLTARPPTPAPKGALNVRVPRRVLGATCIIGLFALGVVGAFVYYPDRDQCMDQMFAVYADAAVAVRTGRTEEAVRHLELWDQLVRKLEVGTYLRNYGVTGEQSKSAEELREAIEAVRDELLARNTDAAKETFKAAVEVAYRACKAAYPK